MGVKYNILRDMRRDRVLKIYEAKHRLIDPAVYKELKARKKCGYCHKPFSGCVPEVHHKVPISKWPEGKKGVHDIANLLAVHPKCHRILDAAEGVGNEESEEIKG